MQRANQVPRVKWATFRDKGPPWHSYRVVQICPEHNLPFMCDVIGLPYHCTIAITFTFLTRKCTRMPNGLY